MGRKKATPKPGEGQPIAPKKTTIDLVERTMTIVENAQKTKIPLNNKQIAEILYGKKIALRCKNEKQKELVRIIDDKEITIVVGPAGTGKSYVSVYKALELLANPETNYQKIFVITPNVEADEIGVGFLPGPLEDKLFPYLFSTYYLMDKIIGKVSRKKLQELNIVEPLALGFLRGANIDNAILIFEEAQNSTVKQMKTLVTRIGFSSKFIISGDIEQTDLNTQVSGLSDALGRFGDLEEIGLLRFNRDEIVRNPVISKILNRY